MCKSRATFSIFLNLSPYIFYSDNLLLSCICHSSFCTWCPPCFKRTHILDAQNSTFLYPPHRISNFIPSSSHLSISTLHLSLLSLCCGLCPSSLSELLSPLSAASVETKSSSAHGKRQERNKRDSAKPKKRELERRENSKREWEKTRRKGRGFERDLFMLNT